MTNQDFFAVELVRGHVHYVFNLGYSTVSVRDRSPEPLNDDRWHSVSLGRPSRFSHTLLVDEQHLATANTRGDNLHLDLDGILFLGGVRATMYGKLPKQILSTEGFQVNSFLFFFFLLSIVKPQFSLYVHTVEKKTP